MQDTSTSQGEDSEVADAERISVSVETLRSELAQLELRLVDRLTAALAQKADLAEIHQLEQRVQSLELSRAARESHADTLLEHSREIERFKRFRYAFPGVSFVSLCLAGLALWLQYQ